MIDPTFLTSKVDFNFGGGAAIVFAILCGLIAASKGRSVVLWAILGLIFSCFALIVVACLSDLDEVDAEGETRLEVRRLKERLKQEQLKNKRFRTDVEARLGSHDAALGMDTRNAGPQSLESTPHAIGSAPTNWFYDDDGRIAGPVARETVIELAREGRIRKDTYVWREGMSGWQHYGDVGELG